jgi:hypothetical protein
MLDRYLMQQELESEANAAYDYMQEAYGPTARDAEMFAMTEVCPQCDLMYLDCAGHPRPPVVLTDAEIPF